MQLQSALDTKGNKAFQRYINHNQAKESKFPTAEQVV